MPLIKVKKDGKIVKDKNGRQAYRVRVNFVDVNGKKRQVERMAYGLAEATLLEQQLVTEYKEKKQAVIPKMTVQQLCDEYEKYHAMETRKSTHDNTMKILSLRVLPILGNYQLSKITQPVLTKWKLEIDKQDIALGTKRNGYKALSALLNFAVKMEYLPKNPLTTIGNFRDANTIYKPADTLHYYTPDEFLKYIAVAEETAKTVIDWGYFVSFNIAFYVGARKGEINALKWSDIEGNVMHIRRSIAQKLKGEDIETPPKNKSSYRNIQIPAPLMRILAEHKERQRAATHLFSENFRICGGERSLRDTSIENHNKKFAAMAGLPHIRIHDFRHSHASVLVNNGINIQEVARRLGHSDIEMTWNTYAHLYPREEERAVEVLNQIVKT
ncbi:MAG: site-specific integrase [Ruminococcaceae bacterium]|nr:site-specific integrase [Oscillospiraceae bacterium]